jgi:segregation and condensation protein B
MKEELWARIEAILFAAGEPVRIEQIMEATGQDEPVVRAALEELKNTLSDARRLRLSHDGRTYTLITNPDYTDDVQKYLGAQVKPELTKPVLETLAVIAYRQPITKNEIDEIRGVTSDQTVKNLLLRGLIVEQGKKNEAGHPVLYETSHKFLQHFGLSSPTELPPLETLE